MTRTRRSTRHVLRAAVAVALAAGALLSAPSTAGAVRPTDAGGFIAVSSKRVFDTNQLKFAPCVDPSRVRAVSVAGSVDVPADAAAVAVNITVVRPTASGYLTAFPAGVPRPTASNINFTAGSIVPNSAIVRLGTKGQINLFVSAGCAHVIVDVTGYFTSGESKGNGSYTGMTPQRALDTRTTGGCVAGGASRTTLIAGSFGVPANAVAVAVNVTAVLPTGPGYLVAFPGGTTVPTASTLNFTAGQVVANATSVKLGGGKLSVFSGITSPCVHVVVDVVGYYLPGNAATPVVAPGGFGPVTPQRVFDSRSATFGSACIPGGTARTITVTSPSGATPNAVALNVTVTAPTAGAYVTVFTAGIQPSTSTLNVVPGQTVANGALVKPSKLGTVGVYVSAGCAHVIVDRIGVHVAGGVAPTLTGTPRGVVAGQAGDRDGAPATARVPGASWLARNATTGDLYVTETALHTVRKITAAGTVTTLAGSAGLPGSTDGTGTSARFNAPSGLALLANGDLLVADSGNATIRKITPAGVVTTVAGTAGARGAADGAGTSSRFSFPVGLAVRPDGQVLVTDTGAHDVRKIDTAGVVSRVAGGPGTTGTADGAAATARFSSPAGVAVMPDGRIAVADSGNNLIRMISSNLTTVSTYAGNSSPSDLSAAGGSRNGDGLVNALFNQPAGLAASPTGELFVADRFGHGIRRIDVEQFVSTISGTLNLPDFSDGTGDQGRLRQPVGLVTDGAGSFWVGDQGNSAVRVLSPTFALTTLVGGPNRAAGTADGPVTESALRAPAAATADASGTVYIADAGNCTIRKSVGGTVSTLAGTAGACGIADGTGAAARFNSPRGITVGLDGNLYVADSLSHSIRKVTPAGVVTTLAGANNSATLSFITPAPGWTDASTGAAARFNEPSGIAVAPNGLLMVADTNNHSIRTVSTTTGETRTYSGNGSPGFPSVSFPQYWSPVAVAVDALGFVFVADRDNGYVRVIDPGSLTTSSLSSPTFGDQFFGLVQGVAVDSRGTVYVTTANRLAVEQWKAGAEKSDFLGQVTPTVPLLPSNLAQTFLPRSPATIARTVAATQLVDPAQVAFGDDGQLYVVDRGGSTVVKVG